MPPRSPDHDLGIRYDPAADRLTASPQLDEHLKLVIATPPSKGRFWRWGPAARGA